MTRYREQLASFWEGLETSQRRQLVAAIALTLLALIAVGFWSSSTHWRTLVSDRSYDDLLRTAAALDEAGIAYRLTEQGTLDVPAEQLGTARSAMGMTSGLPSLQDVDELKLGLTPRAQEWAFLRAREGDIARMLGEIDGVGAAQVHIVPRSEGLFLEESEPATASVFLRMRPGASPSQSQVRAMLNLVANAVEGLDSSSVSVTDDHGRLLASGDGATIGGSPSDLLATREKLQRSYESAAREALLPVLGSSSAFSVTASVDLDMTSKNTVSKIIDSEKPAVLSEQMDESANERAAAGGVPGVEANLPERAANRGNAQNSERMASTMNYVYPTIDEVVHQPAGAIERVSVAVQVDSARLALIAGDAEGAVEKLQESVTETVRAAVGASDQRGDVVSVAFMPFAEREWVQPDALPTPLSTPESLDSLMRYGLAALALLLGFFGVVRPLVNSATSAPLASKDEDEDEDEDKEDEGPDLAMRLHELVDNFDRVESSDLSRLVEQNATASAQVLRHWNKG